MGGASHPGDSEVVAAIFYTISEAISRTNDQDDISCILTASINHSAILPVVASRAQ